MAKSSKKINSNKVEWYVLIAMGVILLGSLIVLTVRKDYFRSSPKGAGETELIEPLQVEDQ